MLEQRQFARLKTLLGGRISADKFEGWSVDCVVKNLGRGGARLAVSSRTTLPTRFKLDISTQRSEPACLVWHKDGIVGVSFDPVREETAATVPDQPGTADVSLLDARIAAVLNRKIATPAVSFERRRFPRDR